MNDICSCDKRYPQSECQNIGIYKNDTHDISQLHVLDSYCQNAMAMLARLTCSSLFCFLSCTPSSSRRRRNSTESSPLFLYDFKRPVAPLDGLSPPPGSLDICKCDSTSVPSLLLSMAAVGVKHEPNGCDLSRVPGTVSGQGFAFLCLPEHGAIIFNRIRKPPRKVKKSTLP